MTSTRRSVLGSSHLDRMNGMNAMAQPIILLIPFILSKDNRETLV